MSCAEEMWNNGTTENEMDGGGGVGNNTSSGKRILGVEAANLSNDTSSPKRAREKWTESDERPNEAADLLNEPVISKLPGANVAHWRQILPIAYDWFTQTHMQWPSLTCRWATKSRRARDKLGEVFPMYTSAQTDGSEAQVDYLNYKCITSARQCHKHLSNDASTCFDVEY